MSKTREIKSFQDLPAAARATVRHLANANMTGYHVADHEGYGFFTHEAEGIQIVNPFGDVTDQVNVDPVQHYGDQFLKCPLVRHLLAEPTEEEARRMPAETARHFYLGQALELLEIAEEYLAAADEAAAESLTTGQISQVETVLERLLSQVTG